MIKLFFPFFRETRIVSRTPGRVCFGQGKRQRGVALVLVLGFLVLITVLIVAFFPIVTTEAAGAHAAASSLVARELADSAVNIVKGTIRNATDQGINFAWASQPGMIRIYDSTGQPVNYYKLYSSDNMILSGGNATGFNPVSNNPDMSADWKSMPAVFV